MSSRKLLATVLVFLLMIGMVSAAQPARAATQLMVTYGQPAGTITAGQTFSIPVNLSVPVDKPFTGGQFNLSWNPAVLSLVNITNGTYFNTATCPTVPTMFFQPPVINNIAGTMTNYGMAALGLPLSQGCTGNGVFVTLNFQAVATGRSTNLVSGVILSDPNGQEYPSSDFSFPGFTQFVGQKLVVTNFALQAVAAGSSDFTAKATIANQGVVNSLADSVALTTDGDSTPLSISGVVPTIPAGGSVVVDITGFSLVAGKASSVVTLKFADQTLTATYAPTYLIYLPAVIR